MKKIIMLGFLILLIGCAEDKPETQEITYNGEDMYDMCFGTCLLVLEDNGINWIHRTNFGLNASYPPDNYCNLNCVKITQQIK